MKKIIVIIASLMLCIGLIGCTKNMEEQSLLDNQLVNSQVAALGTPTNKNFKYEEVELKDFDENKYCALLIFPSAVDEILKNKEDRQIIRQLACPLVLIDQKDVSLSQLYTATPTEKGDHGDKMGEIQYTKVYKEGKEKEVSFYNTNFEGGENAYKALTDYIIAFNKADLPSQFKYYEAIIKGHLVEKGDYKSLYEK